MAYYRHKRLPDLGERIDVSSFTTEDEILQETDSDYVVVVANVQEGVFDHFKYKDKSKDKRFASVTLENLIGFEKPMSLERSLWPELNYLSTSSPNVHRVVCIVEDQSRVIPVNIVGSKYTVLQNRFVIRDALHFLKNSRGSARLVSAGSHLSGRLFSAQLTFDVLEIQIEDKLHLFDQHATLFTSHDSSQAYSLAFGHIGQADTYYSSWQTMKIKHTPKMQDHTDKVKNFLEGKAGPENSFIAEVSSLGRIPLDPNSGFYAEILGDILISQEESDEKYDYDRRSWEFAKVLEYYLAASKTYGFNAWSLYTALNQFSFDYKNRLNSDNPITSLRDSRGVSNNKQFEMQNKLKALLLPPSLSSE